VVYTVFIIIVFCLPPNELVLWTMVGLGVLLFLYWQFGAKKWFKGPKKATEEQLREIERLMDEAAHGKAHSAD
jgi:hypothetical protein